MDPTKVANLKLDKAMNEFQQAMDDDESVEVIREHVKNLLVTTQLVTFLETDMDELLRLSKLERYCKRFLTVGTKHGTIPYFNNLCSILAMISEIKPLF